MTTHLSTGFKVLDAGDLNGDGRLDVLDIDELINRGNGLTSNPMQNQGG